MKKIIHVLLAAHLLLIAHQVVGQSSLIRGRIIDQSNKETLAGATLLVKGTNRGTMTNLNGEFTLYTNQGEQEIEVKYIGYNDTTIVVSPQSGRTEIVEIALRSRNIELEGLIVNGNLQGQSKALNQQKAADNIKNIVAADQIGRFPDPNAAEALQRIPGVNIERDQGEGRYVLIRGLAPQFTNISVNGEQIPSPEAGVRFVALDAIPADQLASIEVSKTLTPDMDGDAIGGNVNLITRQAEYGEPTVNGTLVGGYNNLMQKPNLQGSLQLANRFGKNEKLGIMINSSYYHNDLGSDNWEREPFDNELELRDYELTRTRLGLSSTIDYNLNDNNQFYFRTLYSKFTDREWRRRTIFIPEDDEIERNTKDRFESQSITSINLGGVHTLPKFTIDYEVQYSYGEQNTPYDSETTFIGEIPSTINFSNPRLPTFSAPGYLENGAYEFDEFTNGSTIAKDQNITGKINIAIPYSLGTGQGTLKMGGKVRFKEKSFFITENVFEARGDVPTLDFFEGGLLDNSFYNNQFQLSRSLEMGKFITYFNSNPQNFELQIEDKAIDEALESYVAEEKVYAGYIMARHQFEKLMLVGGVRYEKTDVNYQSNDVIIAPNGDLDEIRPVQGTNSYDFLLPQINARYKISPFTNIRAAATLSYARPNFEEIVPSQEANLEDREATVGNPDLLPVSALNLDLMGEHYFGNVGIFSGGVFYKKLNDFIYPRVLFNSQYPLTGTPIATNLRVTQTQNGEDADLLGFEFAYQRNLDFLPGRLKGLSVYANYTYTNSEARIQDRSTEDPNATEVITLPGQATHVGNFSLGFDTQRFNIRISTNFNGEYLSEVGGEPEEDLYISSRMQIDASASYALSNKFRLFGEFLNITNQAFEAYTGDKNTVTQLEIYSWWSRVGIKFNL